MCVCVCVCVREREEAIGARARASYKVDGPRESLENYSRALSIIEGCIFKRKRVIIRFQRNESASIEARSRRSRIKSGAPRGNAPSGKVNMANLAARSAMRRYVSMRVICEGRPAAFSQSYRA
jgi:hypothetical protein